MKLNKVDLSFSKLQISQYEEADVVIYPQCTNGCNQHHLDQEQHFAGNAIPRWIRFGVEVVLSLIVIEI